MKQFSLLSIVLLLICVFDIRANVQPITIGEGVWNVVTRIGSEVDLLDTSMIKCDVLITNADIAGGGSYTISTDCQKYCLAESVDFSTGPAIEISASNIILDLQGRIMDARGTASNGILLSNGATNVTIKNGTIKNIGTGSAGIVGEDDDLTLKDIVIRNIDFENNVNYDVLLNQNTNENSVDGLVIEGCRSFDSGRGMNAESDSSIVRNCLFSRSDGIVPSDGYIHLEGKNNAQLPRFAFVQDCIFTGTGFNESGTANGIEIEGAQNARIDYCIMDGVARHGIELRDTVNASITDCLITAPGQSGICAPVPSSSPAIESLVIERCVIQNPDDYGFELVLTVSNSKNIKIVDCVAVGSTTRDGFYVRVDETVENILFKNCCAMNNTGNGFVVFSNGSGADTITNIMFDNCITQNNGGEGFNVYAEDAAAVAENIVFRNCISQNNLGTYAIGSVLGSGFALARNGSGTLQKVIIQSCIAQANVGDGFDLYATATDVKIIDCCAFDNTGTGISNELDDANFLLGNAALRNSVDIVGLTDPAKRPPYSLAGSLMGAGRWVNVVE